MNKPKPSYPISDTEPPPCPFAVNERIMKELKCGDIIMIFGNPIKLEYPVGQARLVKKLSEPNEYTEQWYVEYLDDEGHTYLALINKNGKNK